MTTGALPSCPFSSTRVTPGISRHEHPEGEPCTTMYKVESFGDTLVFLESHGQPKFAENTLIAHAAEWESYKPA